MKTIFKALPAFRSIIIWCLLLGLCWSLGGCEHLHMRPGTPGEQIVGPLKSEAYYHYMQAQRYLMADDAESAVKEYEEALKYDPNSAQMET